jgi:hypothetical protein
MLRSILVKIFSVLGIYKFESPLLLFIAIFFILLAAGGLFLVWGRNAKLNWAGLEARGRFRFAITLGSYLVIFNYIFLVFIYVCSSEYMDHAEPNIAAVSWLFKTGHPLYPKLESAERYINNYGPVLYAINGFVLNLLGPSIGTSKITGALAGLISLASIFYTLEKVSGFRKAIICSACITLLFLFVNSSAGMVAATFWVRPDPLLLMCVSVGLLGAVRGRPAIAALLCALSLGINFNLKIFALLYVLPIYVLLYQQVGLSYTLASLAGSIIIAVAPFLAFPQVSLENYILWLRQVSTQGIELGQLIKNIAWFIYVSLPIIFVFVSLMLTQKRNLYQLVRGLKFYILALLVSGMSVAIIGAKSGALENNMLPLLPLLSYLFVLAFERLKGGTERSTAPENISKYLHLTVASAAIALLASTLLVVIPNEGSLLTRLLTYPGHYAVKDIEGVVKSYPEATIGMGYSTNNELSFYRPVLIFRGNPYLLDAASMMEIQKSGIDPISSKTLEALRSCQTKIWLIPKGSAPFQLASYYAPRNPVFSEEFKRIFLDTYALGEPTNYYDLWVCKNKES